MYIQYEKYAHDGIKEGGHRMQGDVMSENGPPVKAALLSGHRGGRA